MTQLTVQSTLSAAAVDNFNVEPAHRVHNVTEMIMLKPLSGFSRNVQVPHENYPLQQPKV